MTIIGNDTTWNKHHGVGLTLLVNWFEDRTVGDKILTERDNKLILNTEGHKVF